MPGFSDILDWDLSWKRFFLGTAVQIWDLYATALIESIMAQRCVQIVPNLLSSLAQHHIDVFDICWLGKQLRKGAKYKLNAARIMW